MPDEITVHETLDSAKEAVKAWRKANPLEAARDDLSRNEFKIRDYRQEGDDDEAAIRRTLAAMESVGVKLDFRVDEVIAGMNGHLGPEDSFGCAPPENRAARRRGLRRRKVRA